MNQDLDHLPQYILEKTIALIQEIAPQSHQDAAVAAEIIFRRAIRLIRHGARSERQGEAGKPASS